MKKVQILLGLMLLIGLTSCGNTDTVVENDTKVNVETPVEVVEEEVEEDYEEVEETEEGDETEKTEETPVVDDEESVETGEEESEDEEIIEEEKTDNDENADVVVKEFEMDSFTEIVDGKYFPQYSIKNLEVNVGDIVRLKINTKGTHDFNIDELNVSAETPDGEVTIVEFTADKAGTFEYYCSKPNHRKNGHFGTIVVK